MNLKKAIPYITAVILFLVISFSYFPDVLQGKKLNQHDKKTWKGSAKEIFDYRERTGENSLWTNSMFGGMPAYLITTKSNKNITSYIYKVLDLNGEYRPATYIFLMILGFYFALLLFGVNPWLSIVGAVAYGFSTYFFIIIEAGHLTKVIALSFMPPVIAGIYHSFNKNRILGILITSVFLSLQILANHLQITYYSLIIILIFIIFQFVKSLKDKQLKSFFITASLLLLSAVIAVSVNITRIMATYEYTEDSIRGKSELTFDKTNQTSGLDKDYALSWSYGKTETLNLLIPNLMGGVSGGEAFTEMKQESNTYSLFKQAGYPDSDIQSGVSAYWGPQSFTSGPVYIGAILIFLFVFGLFLVKGQLKWWLFTITVLSVFLAWGKNFMFLSNLFLDYFPFYNKFRTVSMILIIAEFAIPLLAFLALKNIIDKSVTKQEILKALKWSFGIIGGIIAVLLINPGILSFLSEQETASNIQKELSDALITDRKAMFRADAFRSLGFIVVAVIILWLFIQQKIKRSYFFIALGLLVLVDLWAVNKRYLNGDDFVSARIEKEPFTASNADKFILKDKDPNFRVLNLTVNTFNDASTSYFHKSIGGYHGAKMRRYQELITYGISQEMTRLIDALNNSSSEQEVHASLMGLSILNMLNTKYIILNPQMIPMMNKFRLGNSWFVNEIKIVENADEEIKSVTRFNPERTAVIDKRYNNQFFKFVKDTSAVIQLTKYEPNYLSYISKASSDQLAVFSEIFYDKDWSAYIDGKQVPHMRANYVLRAMKIPAGEHTIEFKNESKIWAKGEKISFIGSILFMLMIVGGIFYLIKHPKKVEQE